MAFTQTASPGSKIDGTYTPPTPASPGSPEIPGTDPTTTTTTPTFPGIQGVLGSDPNYQQLLAFDTAASGQDLATMNANIASMQAYYGSDSNPLSVLGRIYQGLQDRNRTISNTLTGHGMINSGETGFQGARATLAYQQQEYDAQFKLQQYISGLQQAFANAERQQKFNELQASQAAVQSWLNLNPPVSTTTPGTDPVAAVPATPGTPASSTNPFVNQILNHGDSTPGGRGGF
jgi:hypothetical protein